MKKITLLCIIFSAFVIRSALATTFSSASISLDRLKTSSALVGFVCATPSSSGAGTEAKIAITFPSSFSINATTSNWTTSTGTIPAGTTAWPGIGATAQTVSGQTVTFASNDLTANVSYCFRVTGTSSTTGSSTGNLTGTLTSKNSSNTTIDATNFAVAISSNDQISVSATVPASPSDFEATLTKLTSGTTFSQNQTIEYELTYGSTLSYASAITVKAEWSQGSGSYDVLDYVSSSASNAYGSTAPVIDTVNRTITWTISSIPANTTGQTVTFSLKTNDNYTGASTLDFSVSGRVLGPGTQTSDSTITSYYQYSITSTPTPTPTPTSAPSSSTPTPTATTSTPTPTPTPTTTKKPVFSSIEITQVDIHDASIEVRLKEPGVLKVLYGDKPTSLTNNFSLSKAKNHLVSFSNLSQETTYYVKFVATTNSGQTTSDIYTFTTAAPGEIPEPDPVTLIITSNKVILDAPGSQSQDINNDPVVIPQHAEYEFRIRIPNAENIIRIQAIFRKKNILGIRNFGNAEASSKTSELMEIQNGIFSGRLIAPSEPGEYQLILRIYSSTGSIVEKTLRDISVTRPFTVINGRSKDPLEDARVLLSLWNEKLKLYQKISPSVLHIDNPAFTNSEGILEISLPKGKYQAVVSNINFADRTITFTIGKNGGYPLVELDEAKITLFSIPRIIRYGYRSFNDVFIQNASIFVRSLASSKRMFNLAAFVVLASSSIILTLSLKRRTSLAPVEFLNYILFHITHLIPSGKRVQHISGTITDATTDSKLSSVSLYLTKVGTKELVAQTTSKNGLYSFKTIPYGNYELRVMKFGYTTLSTHLHISNTAEVQKNFALIHHPKPLSFIQSLHYFLEHLLVISFEGILITMVIIGGAIFYYGGWESVTPFLGIAIFNLIFWMRHQRGN